MSLAYTDKVPESIRSQFENKVNQIASYLMIDPNWLMQTMYSESGLNPQAKNISKKDGHLIASGLLQWTKASGQDTGLILNLNALQQLDLVKKYFEPYKGKMFSYFDVYLVTFFPAAIGKSDNYIFKTSKYSPALIASQNPAINKDGDAIITMGEFKSYVRSTVQKKYIDLIFSTKGVSIITLFFLVFILTILIYKK